MKDLEYGSAVRKANLELVRSRTDIRILPAVDRAPQASPSTFVLDLALASLLMLAAVVVAFHIFPRNFAFVRMPWLLHPFEQEHLLIARNLAHGHGLTIEGDFPPEYGPEDKGLIDGRFVPRGVLLPYPVYAASFLISDTAWLYVTLLFGCLALVAMVALVYEHSHSSLSALAAGAALACTSPFILATSGVAYEGVIALAFVLWGAYAYSRFSNTGLAWWGLASGALFACSVGSRVDFMPAPVLFIVLAFGSILWSLYKGESPGKGKVFGALGGSILALAGAGSVFVQNYIFTGDPLRSAYPQDSWLGSASGVSRGLVTIHMNDLVNQTRYFLWDIGRPTLPFLALGVVVLCFRRTLDLALLLLLCLAAFLIFFHLTRSGSFNSGGARLDSSVPRYLLAVYAVAIVVGFTAVGHLSRAIFVRAPVAGGAATLAVALIVCSMGLHEAYKGRPSVPLLAASLAERRAAFDFSREHPEALFIGDYNASAVITSPRILIPRTVREHERVTELIRSAFADGRRVFVLDDWRGIPRSPYYSGYVSWLSSSGFSFCPASGSSQLSHSFLAAEILDAGGTVPEEQQLILPVHDG
jgi:hypothetical protein